MPRQKLTEEDRIARKKARRKADYAKNKERYKARAKDYHYTHHKYCLERNRKWARENKETKKLSDQKYIRENKDKVNTQQREYRKKHPEKAAIYQATHKAKNPDKYRENHRRRTQKRRAKLMGATVGDTRGIMAWERSWKSKRRVTCWWCRKEFHPKKCHTDHVTAIANGGEHSLSNLVISCAFCNQSKNDRSVMAFNSTLEQPVLLLE